MKKIKIAIASAIVFVALGSVSSSYAFDEGKLKVRVCYVYDANDNIIGVGNDCPAGSAQCLANPCSPGDF